MTDHVATFNRPIANRPFSLQDTLLEQWYWHTLYFNNWTEATKAQEKIKQTLDLYCLYPMPTTGNRYTVTFSTNYPFEAEHQQGLIILIGPQVDFETVFNRDHREDAEDLFKGFQWSEPEKPDRATPKSRIHVAHNLCTLCGTRPRASYGLWCTACKRTSRKSEMIEPMDEEEDLLDPSSPCYWHTLCFSILEDARRAQKYIRKYFDEYCTIDDEYHVVFSTNSLFDEVFRTHLALNIGVSPIETTFNETLEEMAERMKLEAEYLIEPQVTIRQVVIALILTILLLPLAQGVFLVHAPTHLIEIFHKRRMFE